jgi:hypothetical protein
VAAKNKGRLHQKYLDKREDMIWNISSHDISKYHLIKKLSILNYYIYIEKLEAERQRQEKANKKAVVNRKR